MYFTDRGIEELAARRGDEQVPVAWLAERLRDFVDQHPDFETAIDRLASWLARLDDDPEDIEGLLCRTAVVTLPDVRVRGFDVDGHRASQRLETVSLPAGSAHETGIWQALRAKTA